MHLLSRFKAFFAQAPLLLCVLLLVLFSMHIAWQSYQWFSFKAPASGALSEPSPSASLNATAISALFENTQPHPQQVQSTVTDLTLSGIFVHDDPAKSSALIAHSGTTHRYTSGQDLADGTRIKAIYRDHVELERRGRMEFLRFPKAAFNYDVEKEQEALDQRVREMEQLRAQMEAASNQYEDPTLTNTAMESE